MNRIDEIEAARKPVEPQLQRLGQQFIMPDDKSGRRYVAVELPDTWPNAKLIGEILEYAPEDATLHEILYNINTDSRLMILASPQFKPMERGSRSRIIVPELYSEKGQVHVKPIYWPLEA